jgi:DNA-binding HxlR family transcriptional regulator
MSNPDHDRPNILESQQLSSDYETYLEGDHLACAVEVVFKVIGGRWKVLIFRELLLGKKRFNQLHRAIHGISHKMLTQQLREMEESGIIHREVYHESVLKVEYSLTSWGKSLHPVIDCLHQWGVQYLEYHSAQSQNRTSE